ncbi:Ldh family oxidoreductase [Brachybacterium sp. GCM10030267]|uniref:Ldh family oxidoreductase n=1 Tax=Brachybacterium sp. GCM10030267 TaxID=3273381 RepID=UPI003616E26B
MTSPVASRQVSLADLEPLCARAVRAAGGSPEMAATLATATVGAERRGKSAVGAAHLVDYLDALRDGRLHGGARPRVERPRAAAVRVDADRGTAQLAYDHGAGHLVEAARHCGVAVLSMHSAFPAGELAFYASRTAQQGLVALVCGNSPALMAAYGSRQAVTGTNPLAFALPHSSGPRVFDQASSATAWVRVREAAQRGEPIPPGWGLGPDGEPTTDASAALAGALLPFGGAKGANIAMMIEMLATMSGGTFSLDAAPFDSGSTSPSLGLFIAAIDPTAFDPRYEERIEEHLTRLAAEHGVDVGRRKAPLTEIDLPEDLYQRLAAV